MKNVSTTSKPIIQTKTVKRQLLDRIDAVRYSVQTAQLTNRKRSLKYYAEILSNYLKKINAITEELYDLAENATLKDAFIVNEKIKDVELEAPLKIENPDYFEALKVSALYYAAMKDVTKDLEGTQPSDIEGIVKKIIYYQNILNSHQKAIDQTEFAATKTYLQSMFDNLVRIVSKKDIPNPEYNFQIILGSEKKLQEMKNLNKDDEAGRWEADLEGFAFKNADLNFMLPIDSIEKLEKFHRISKLHYLLSMKLKVLLLTEVKKGFDDDF